MTKFSRWAWPVIGIVAVFGLLIGFMLRNVRETAEQAQQTIEAVEDAASAIGSAADAVTELNADSIDIDVDSIRATSVGLGGALGAGLRAVFDSATADRDTIG